MAHPVRLSIALILTILFILALEAGAGVWEDEFAVTQDPVLQYRSYLAVAPDDTVFVLWPDWADFEDTKVMLTSSADMGLNWTTPHLLFEGAAYDNFDLMADGNGLHLLIVEFREDNDEYKELYYSKSTDMGQTFSPLVRIGTRDKVEQVRLLSEGDMLYAYAMNYAGASPDNYLYVSPDGGTTWQEKTILAGWSVSNPDFHLEDGVIHMAFGGFLVTPEIQYSQSLDGGDTWSTPAAVSTNAGKHSQLPQVTLDDFAIHVAWEDDRTNHFNIFYSRSTDGGVTWNTDVQVNDTYYGARNKLIVDGEGLHLFWCQYHGNNGWPSSWSSADYGIIWSKFSGDGGVTWSEEFRVSQNEHIPPIDLPDQGANYVKVAAFEKGLCTLWQDKRDGNYDLYMRNRLPLAVDSHYLSELGGTVDFTLAPGMDHANRTYLLLGSVSGTSPGVPLPGGQALLPLNWDLFTNLVVFYANSPLFQNFMGTLDSTGMAGAQMNLGSIPGATGATLYFAFALNGPWDYASNPAPVEIVP